MAMNLSDPVMAALIGAGATFATAIFQLTSNARRQAAERAAGKPASRKTGSWLAIFALVLASLVTGYALSEYQTYSGRQDEKLLRDELLARVRDISAARCGWNAPERKKTARPGPMRDWPWSAGLAPKAWPRSSVCRLAGQQRPVLRRRRRHVPKTRPCARRCAR